jgi:sigma-B regulation protein RsbU (phosphoserine phosphatase)
MSLPDPAPPAPEAPAAVPRRVLVVDDSRAQRRVLALSLSRGGYAVTEAASGAEALALCRETPFDVVISDWMMPGMSGLDLCRAFRALPREGYGYFILLTSKSDKSEVADGLDCGADDFLSKPVNPGELRARLRAGERILGMQQELVEKNRLVGATLRQLQALYDSIDRDLIEARKLQETLVRDRLRDFGRAEAALLVRPSGHVGGDLAGAFEPAPGRVAIFSVDVSGHGVAAAMMTARLAGLLSGTDPARNIALVAGPGGMTALPPQAVAERLNRLMIDDMQTDQYVTLAYADLDLSSGALSLVQAGHPHPVILRAAGGVDRLGQGGLPVGLLPGATWHPVADRLHPGDRLFLMTDGITECAAPDGTEFGADGWAAFLSAHADLPSPALFEALIWTLAAHRGGDDFQDDVSGAALLFRG